ncbi:hypothetical protein ACOZCG_29245 [Streptomyces pseudogriseolus]|uniref:hypothetical protein n=1 Tax=Streptomyces pseudogriseolus TaxID=36817 RepID=UPI003FA2AEF0
MAVGCLVQAQVQPGQVLSGVEDGFNADARGPRVDGVVAGVGEMRMGRRGMWRSVKAG